MRILKTTSVSAADVIRQTIANKRLSSGLLWNLLATLAGRSAGLVSAIIVSRSLGREVFGEFSIIQSTVFTFGVFAGFGSGLTATKHIAESFRRDPDRAGRTLALSMALAFAFGVAMTAVLILCSPLIAERMLKAPDLAPFLRIASLSLIASSLNGAQCGALAGFEEFRRLSRVNIYSGLAGIVCVAAGVAVNGLPGALWGYALATVASCFAAGAALRAVARGKGVIADYRQCMQEWPVLWRFSLPNMLANALVTPAAWLCNAMLVRRPDGFAEMAVYNAASQWRQILLFLPSIVSQVFLPIMSSQSGEHGREPTKSLYAKINLLVATPFLIVLSALSPSIMALYGRDFDIAWKVFVVVQLATFMQIIQGPAIISWAADGRMWTNFIANAFWGAFLVLLSWLFISLGALGLALALMVSFMLYFAVIKIAQRGIAE